MNCFVGTTPFAEHTRRNIGATNVHGRLQNRLLISATLKAIRKAYALRGAPESPGPAAPPVGAAYDLV